MSVTRERSARTAAIMTAAVFATNGAMFGNWVTRIPAVRDGVHASASELGLVLLCIGGGSLVSMPTTGFLVRRFGSKRVVSVSAVLSGALFTTAGAVPSVWALGLALAATGLNWGVWDVAMNVQGHLVERRLGHALMPRYHGCWSGGSVCGSGFGALMASANVPVPLHLGGAAAVLVGCCLVAAHWFVDDRGGGPEPNEEHLPVWKVLNVRLVLIGLVTLCGTVGEGAASDWLAVLFTDERGAPPGLAALAFTTFTVAMTGGRFLGTTTIERLGRVWALRLTGLVAALGVACTLALPGLASGLVGAALWGLGISIVFPAAMSAAGDASRRPADAIAAVSTVGYGGFLVGPPSIGFLAGTFGLGNALWFVSALALGIVALAAGTRHRTGGGDVTRRSNFTR